MGEWLEIDGVQEPGDDGLVLASDGLRSRVGDHLTVVPWDRVLGVERVAWREREVLYVMTSREPPRPPWIEVTRETLPEGAEDLAALERAIEARVGQVGFRDAARPGGRMEILALRDAVLARRNVDGMVEIPAGAGPPRARTAVPLRPWMWLVGPWLIAGTILAVGTLASAGYTILAAVMSVELGIAMVVGAVVAGYALFGAAYWLQRRRASRVTGTPRVLVLSPDGFVIGTRSGVRWFRWTDGELGPRRRRDGGWQLAVARPDGTIAEAVDAEWFDGPLALIVAIAKAYRERAVAR